MDMNKGNAKAKQVGQKEMLEELLAMIRVCFEGEASVQGDGVKMALPSGEAFVLTISSVA